MNRIKPTEQIYSQYTEEDFAVWNILFNRQMKTLRETAAKDYLAAVDTIGFKEDEIPNFEVMNQKLEKLTGWRIITVPGICPPSEFFQLLAQKTFTCTCWLRSMKELDYLEEPDMFHDVFGHVPLLTNNEYCAFFQTLGTIASEHIDNQDVIDMIERLYWFTIEFGLMEEEDQVRIYGAGIISSVGETKHALGNVSTKHRFDARKVMNHSFRTDIMQEEYFVIQSFDELMQAIPKVKLVIGELLGEKTV